MNLTSLTNVRQWVGSQNTTDDDLLRRLIGEASRMVLNYIQRPDIGMTAITEVISGRGETKLQLRNWPILSVGSVTINGITVPASTGPTVYGYFLEPSYGSMSGSPQNLGIIGGIGLGGGVAISGSYATFDVNSYGRAPPFPRGIGNISVNYSYGYCVQKEPQIVSASSPYIATPAAQYGPWSGDLGVSYANGTPLTAVASSPTTGQYIAPSTQTGESVYTFAAGDAGAGVLLNYNYTPYDLEQACIEVVGERYRYRSRIGQISQSLGGQETSSYLVRDALTAAIKGRLEPYKLDWAG